MNIGFSQKQADVILKYKKQIGGFKSVEDVENCFVISKKKYNELQSYIKFDSIERSIAIKKDTVVELAKVDINAADQALLESVNGIGPFFAKEIIKLRTNLDGFHSVSQIKDIYGMTEENFNRIEFHLKADSDKINPIVLSEANFDQLKKHPYLNWKQSQILVSLSNKTIDEKFWETLLLEAAFSAQDISKIKPYLK